MEFNKFGHIIEFTSHDSNCPPGTKNGLFCNDTVVLGKLDGGDWFRCYYKSQIKAIKFLEMAENESELLELIDEIKYKYYESME
jgi:hypothetical protein